MPVAAPPEPKPSRAKRRKRERAPVRGVARFWQRISDGLEAQQLWKQFHSDAHAGYEHYRREVDWEPREGERRVRRAVRIARELSWAVLSKLTPARRVLLLLAIGMSWVGAITLELRGTEFSLDLRGVGFLLLLLLLGLELADRVIMKRDLEIAREIQHWLVPEHPPSIPGLDIAFTTRPANTVAGDFYDAFLRGPGETRLLIAVADVAGKSVPAALLMATFQAGLHACAHDRGGPLDIVQRLNQLSCARSLEGRRFTTAFLAELDLESRSLHYVNAGHNAPVLRRASGANERLELGGLPLGIDPGAAYELGSTHVGDGDFLFVFTDGLVEAMDASNTDYGDPRLLEALGALRAENATNTIRILIEGVDRFTAGVRQYDDITCLALRVAPGAAEAGR